ncbi:MAG: hypothetical protein RLZ62_2074, partial [Bacteroidota bacterium]
GIQRRKLVNGYKAEIARGRTSMQEALETKLRSYVKVIKGRIAENFTELDAMLANEETQIARYNEHYDLLDSRLKELEKELESSI